MCARPTAAQVREMHDAQGRKCALCDAPVAMLALIDHAPHFRPGGEDAGARARSDVRGLLCYYCKTRSEVFERPGWPKRFAA